MIKYFSLFTDPVIGRDVVDKLTTMGRRVSFFRLAAFSNVGASP